jgi:glycosyltransferase involved in cell wall biosynthesis
MASDGPSPGKLLKAGVRLLGKSLPSAARSRIKNGLRQLLTPDGPVNPYVPGVRGENGRGLAAADGMGMNIVGYIRSEFGIGESARCCARAAQMSNLPFALHDFTGGNAARTGDDTWAGHITRPLPGINVCHINAAEMPQAYAAFGKSFFTERYTVGFWHWELPEFPDAWVGSFALVDEVWVSSRFVLDAISQKSPVPVLCMPHGIHCPVRSTACRADFELPEDHFLFLMMYDTHSFQVRKNPQGAVAAFRLAFPNPQNVSLVVKVNNPQSYPEEMARLRQELAGVPGVILLDRTMSRQEVYDLQSVCDAYISLHRSEGFGLGLAEAMYLGKPVVATHWSGNVDFMTVDNSCPIGYELRQLQEDVGPYARGQFWAEPDIGQAAWCLSRLSSDATWRRAKAVRGQQTIRTWFSPAAVGRLYRGRLAALRQMIAA